MVLGRKRVRTTETVEVWCHGCDSIATEVLLAGQDL